MRRNAKLVANHLISDTCLNAPKWTHRPRGAHTRFDCSTALAPDLHGSTRGWRNNDPQLSFGPPPAPPRHTGRPPLTPRQRASSSQTDSSRAIWRGAMLKVWDYRYSPGHSLIQNLQYVSHRLQEELLTAEFSVLNHLNSTYALLSSSGYMETKGDSHKEVL